MKLKQLFKRGTAILLSIAMVYPLLLPGSTAQAETTSGASFFEDFEDTTYSAAVQRNNGYREPNKAGEDPFWVINDGGYVSGGTELGTNEHSFDFLMGVAKGYTLSMQMGGRSELDLNFALGASGGQYQISLSFNGEQLGMIADNTADAFVWYTVKLLRLGDSLVVKVWKSSEEEPADYAYKVTDPLFADTYGLKVAWSAGVEAGKTVRFDNFSGSFQAEPVPSFNEDFEDTDYSTAVQTSNGYKNTISDKNLWIINDGGYVSGGMELKTNEHSFEFLMYGTKDYTLSMQMGGNSNLNLYFKAINTAKGSLYFNDRLLGESILDLGHYYTAKLLRSGNFLGIKFWKTGETEPTDYTYIVTDPLFADTYGLKVAPAGGAGARFDNFSGKQSTETLEPSFKEDFEDTTYSTAVQRNNGYRTTVSDKNLWIINDGGYVSGGKELSTNEHSFEFFVANLEEAKISMQMGGKKELDLNFTVNDYYVSLSFNDEVLAENTFNTFTWYTVKLLRFGDNLAIKVWESSAEEPAEYTYTVKDSLFADTYGLKVTWSSGATAGKTVRFDNFSGWATEVEEKGFFVDGDINPYTGVLQSTDASQEYTLDATYNSVGYDLKTKQQVNQVVLTDNDGVHRLHHIDLSLYVSDDNVTYTKVPYFDMARSGNQIYLYNFAAEARYVKVHCHYDTYLYDTDKNINGFTNALGSMITAGYETIPGSGGGDFTKLDTMTLTASSNGEDVFGYIPYSKLDSLVQCNADKSDLRFVYGGKMLPYMLDEEGAYVRVPSVAKNETLQIEVYGGNASAVSLSDSEIFEVTYGNKTISELRTYPDHNTQIGVVRAPNGDLLTIAGSYPTGKITQKRSIDGGRTWGNVETIYTWDQKEIDAITAAGGSPYIGMGDQFLVDGDKIWAPGHYGTSSGLAKMELFMLCSEDNGLNWSFIKVNTGKYRSLAFSNPVKVKSYDGAGGNAIDYVFPYQFQDEGVNECMVSAMISRDQGTTWETIDDIIKWPINIEGHESGLSETTTMVLSDGTLKILMRNQYPGTNYFAEATSTDNGLTWSEPTYSNVVSVNTMPASMTRTDADKTEQYLLWAGNNSMGGTSYQRYPFTLAYSDDDTQTWQKKLDLFSGTTRAKFTYNGPVTAFDSSTTGGSGGVTQPSMALSNYKSDGEDLMVTWTHTWGRPNGMLIEDFDNFIHKTKGVSDDFEGSTAKYESWHNATTHYNGNDGTTLGSVELSNEKSKGGSKSLKMHDFTTQESVAAGNKSAVLRATRSIPAMTSGEVSFDVNIEQINPGFRFELKSAFNKTHFDYSLLMMEIDASGGVYSWDVKENEKVKSAKLYDIDLQEWNHFTVKFDVDMHTAQLYVNDAFVADIPVLSENNEPACYAQFSDVSSDADGLICYIDNFRAYEGLTLHADYASTVVAPEITDSIAMNYTTTIKAELPKAILAEGEIPYMTFAMEGKTTVKVEGKLTEGVYTFTYPDIMAQNMAKTITATLVVGNYTKEYEYSVWDYCKTVLDTTDYTKLTGLNSAEELAEVKHLVVDLVQYGANVQAYRKDNISSDLLLLNKLTEEYLAFDIDSASESLDSITQSDKAIDASQASFDYKWKSATLVLKNKINLRFRFTIPEGSTPEDIVVKGTIGSDTCELDIQKDSNGYYVDFDNIMAYEYGEKVDVTIYTAREQKASVKITYSVNSYLFDMKSNTDLTALLLAIHSFGTAAQKYQGQ